MPVTRNDDNGSLFTGEQLLVGAWVQIAGERRPRRVTCVMGSAKKGWRACFKGQGAVPVGDVSWEVIEPPSVEPPVESRSRRPTTAPNATVAPPPPTTLPWPTEPSMTMDGVTAVFSGYDSAWTRTNRGAIASIVLGDGRSALIPPVTAGFDEALALLDLNADGAPLHVIAIDQPLIVPNPGRSRPVEAAVRRTIGRLKGGMQPANRGRIGMFDDDAPIWPFLATLAADLDPIPVPGAAEGRFAIEVYPALATSGLFESFYGRGCQPKYNPANRATFSIEDWRALCLALGTLCAELAIEGGAEWCRVSSDLPNPRKEDQDRLDALICALCAYLWWRYGVEKSVVVGDLQTGYIVAPAHPALADELARNAGQASVPITARA